jgi:hypothetical protein
MIRLLSFLVPLSSLFAAAQPSGDYLYPIREGRKFRIHQWRRQGGGGSAVRQSEPRR